MVCYWIISFIALFFPSAQTNKKKTHYTFLCYQTGEETIKYYCANAVVQRSNGKDNVFKSGCTWNKAKWVKRVYFRLEFRFSLLLICLISFLFSILFALAHHLHEDVFFFASTTIIFLKVFSSVRPFSFTWNPLSQRTFFFLSKS